MSYAVKIKPTAKRALKRLDIPAQKRIAEVLRDLAENPRPPGATALTKAPGCLRIRVADYRVIYQVDDGALVVLVIDVGNRGQIYRKL